LALLVPALLLAYLLLSIGYRYAREQRMVDDCLLRMHGSFDYATMRCDLEQNHPYVPYKKRHPDDPLIAVVAGITLVAILLNYQFAIPPRKQFAMPPRKPRQ
jgi:hypothetical protein